MLGVGIVIAVIVSVGEYCVQLKHDRKKAKNRVSLMACSHCTGQGTGQGRGNDGFLYCTVYLHATQGQGQGQQTIVFYCVHPSPCPCRCPVQCI